jgi:hypothetical protein
VNSITAQRFEQALLKARNKEKLTRRNAQVGTFVFWGATALLAGIAYRDLPSFFTSSWGLRCLALWTIPAAWYMVSWRWAGKAAGEWQSTRKTVADRARPGFCAHENHCSCREDFLQAMETHGIDLYL